MALSFVEYTADGVDTQFTVTFPFIARAHVTVTIDGVDDATFTWINDGLIEPTDTPANLEKVRITRTTPTGALVLTDFADGSTLIEADLDRGKAQAMFVAEESNDAATNSLGIADDDATVWDAETKRIKNIVDPTGDQDAATKKYGDDNWGGAATAEAVAAKDAAVVAQGLAETAQTGAETAETNASTSATAAAASAAAAGSYDMPFVAGFTPVVGNNDVQVATYGQLVAGRAGSFTGEKGFADTAPTDADGIMDITKNGTTIYTTKPKFAAASQTLTAGALKTDGTEDFVAGDRIDFKVTQIGSTIAGKGFRFTVLAEVS